MPDYSHERAKPTVPQCKRSTISVSFDGKHLTLRGKKAQIFPAVSGKRDPKLGFVYSAERQKERSTGPIPAGEYWINFEELWENSWYRRGSRSAWGNYRLTIHVFPGTVTHDRGGFFIHGGAVPGSAGCIDLTNNIDRFVAALRAELKDAGECFVPLTVRY
jgi:hypothetical protein